MYDSVFYALHSRRNEFFPTGKTPKKHIFEGDSKTTNPVVAKKNKIK
jgi:hypothetical protein